MSNLRQAAQQALEALETYERDGKYLDVCRPPIDALRAALAAAVAEPVASVTECEACFTPDVCQLRGTCDHYAAERLRVAAPPQREPYDQTALGLCNACGWKAVGPDGCLNCAPQREPLREGEVMGAYMEFDRTADRAWTNAEYLVRFGLHISTLTAHGISAPASAPKEQP